MSYSTSSGRNDRRNSLPLLHQNHRAVASNSLSDRLSSHCIENRTSDVERSISSDSGCNTSGSDALLDQTEDRARQRTVETTPSDTQLPRDGDISANDSGYQPTVSRPDHDVDTVPVRGWNSDSEIRRVADPGDSKKEANVADGGRFASSRVPAAWPNRSDDTAAVLSSPVDAVRRRASFSAAKSGQHRCAAGNESQGRVATKKLRRMSMTSTTEPDRMTRTRRRHSFMLPNGSDIYPTYFGGAWPSIVEEGIQLTDAFEADDVSAERFPKNVVDAEKNESFSKLPPFLGGAQLANDDVGKPGAVPPSSKENRESASFDDCSAADFRTLGAKLRSGLQLVDPKFGRMNAGLFQKDCGASVSSDKEEGTFADLNALGAALRRATCTPGGTSSSPPTPRSPPSYDEALLHKALRRSDLTEAERLTTYRALAAARRPASCPGSAHLQMTSSTRGDVIVPPEIDAQESEVALFRRPPPPYQLRPRRQNHGEDMIQNQWNGRAMFDGYDDHNVIYVNYNFN